MKTILIWLGVIVLTLGAVGGLFYMSSRNAQNNVNSGNLAPVSLNDWKKGSESAKAVLIEYGDYECPACAVYEPWVEKLSEDFGSSILVVYRQYPLPQHKNADLASRAAEAAGKQGKFWEMHQEIFRNQKNWQDSNTAQKIFEGYASSFGLDVNRFRTDLTAPDIKQKIQNDIKSGNDAGIQGTPTFFLNGTEINNNPRSYTDFKNLIQSKL